MCMDLFFLKKAQTDEETEKNYRLEIELYYFFTLKTFILISRN